MQTKKSLLSLAFLSLSATIINPQPAEAGSFQGLGYLPGLEDRSSAEDVSANGTIVVGVSSASGVSSSFIWTQQAGLRQIPVDDFFVGAISDNGRVVTGSRNGNSEILRWNPSEGVTVIGPEGFADSVSFNGSTIVGFTGNFTATSAAFRWTATEGLVDLGFSDPSLEFSSGSGAAVDVSADGSAIVGFSGDSQTGALIPIRWTEATGPTRLSIDGESANIFGAAANISANGRFIVGFGGDINNNTGGEAILWTGQRSFGFGDLENGTGISIAYDLSDNASVIVGASTSIAGQPFGDSIIFNGQPQEAFIWQPRLGMRSLKTVLTNDYGLDLTGWTLLVATSVSTDGSTIVGTGINPQGKEEAWVANLD
ncbi:MAG: hypothetical protein KTR27_13900 [Leptolyngbyaceae cyanobacterium MAG.088]|nr:hypothetical protein [Leptolyngbyaceae cyanobacterium MAG.088]